MEVKDLPPAITGEYTVKQGEELVLSVELNGKEIVSIVVDGLLPVSYTHLDVYKRQRWSFSRPWESGEIISAP